MVNQLFSRYEYGVNQREMIEEKIRLEQRGFLDSLEPIDFLIVAYLKERQKIKKLTKVLQDSKILSQEETPLNKY